jgi:hypothetical protein
MTALVVDPVASRLAIRTRAAGVLSRLAHDLEIAASTLRGHATLEEDGFFGELVVPVAALRVVGALRGDRVDTDALWTSDRAEIERKMREDVFARTAEVRARARGTSRQRADVTVELATGAITVPVALRVTDEASGMRVEGSVELSLKRLGVAEVKAPLGVFRVKDAVEVIFALTLRPEG